MSFAKLARFASRTGRRLLAAAATLCAAALCAPALAAEPNVVEIVVRFNEAVPIDAQAPSPAQFETVSRSVPTGFAAWSPTIDGGFRVTLAPALPFPAAREAINRLRMQDGIVYANLGRTDAPAPARIVREKSSEPSEPPLTRIIVRYRDASLAANAAADRPLSLPQLDTLSLVAGQALAHERAIAWAGAYLIRLFQPLPREQVEAIAEAIAQQPDVLWAQPDYIDQIHFVPNDPLYNAPPNVQWHYFEALGGVGLQQAWDRTRGWSGVRTSVVDTGSLPGHPDIGARFLGGYDFITQASPIDPRDGNDRDSDASDVGDWVSAGQCFPGGSVRTSSWHGTHVAGTVGALTHNSMGVAGVNHVSRIVPVRVLGACGGSGSDIADGMVWAAGVPVTGVPNNPYPARVINMSLGGFRSNQQCDPVYLTAVSAALANGASVVVSAGNDNVDASFASPANCPNVVTVAATGRAGQRAPYSNHDVNNASGVQVEIAAPGGALGDGELGVLSTLNSGARALDPVGFNFVQYNGTSMAAPHVAGVMSLIYSLKPSLTPAQALAIVTSTARAFPTGTGRDCTSTLGNATGSTRYCGAGIIDANAALTNIMTTGNAGAAMSATTAVLGSSANPVTAGATLTLTAQITGATAQPVGNVAFIDGETPIPSCTAVPLTGAGNARSAQCATTSLAPGTHAIRAVYTPSNTATIPADTPTIPQTVNPASPLATTTTIASNDNPADVGAFVVFTATVTGADPTGTVQFRRDNVAINGCLAVPLAGTGNSRTAQCTTSTLPAGTLTITAIYSGNAHNQTSTGVFAQGITAASGTCLVFNDVAGNDGFCPNVQWLYNRNVTLGCDPANYCANTPVSRLAMAAFMQREGVALTPVDLFAFGNNSPVNVTSAVVACHTQDFTVTGYPRTATMRARNTMWSPSGGMDVSVEHMYSTDGGTTWTAIPDTQSFQTLYSGMSPGMFRTSVPTGEMNLAVGTTYRFALRYVRVAGSGSTVGIHCANWVQITNRNAGSPPL